MSSAMKHQTGIALNWSFQEIAILDNCLIKYASEPNLVKRYLKIKLELEDKTVRDIAMFCRWKHNKESNRKRRKEEDNGSRRLSVVDNKEIIDMVVASSNSNLDVIAQSPLVLREQQHGVVTNELIEQNKQMFSEITANFTTLKLIDNLTFFSKIGENIRKLLSDLNKNVPETMKYMPPLPEKLKEMVRFTLENREEFGLELTGDFCSGLLSGDSLLLSEEVFAGVPEYPLYKRLALSLLKSIGSGCFCESFEKISMVEELIWLNEREDEWSKMIIQKGSQLVNALKDRACEFQVQEPLFSLMKDGIKTVEARCFEAEYDRLRRGSMVMVHKCLMFEVMEVHQYPSIYELLKAESPEKVFPGIETVEEVSQPCVALAHILSGLSYIGVQRLLGLSHTIGSIFHALPPPRSMLLASFMLPYKPQIKGCTLTHGARALAKHVGRSSDRFWGVLHGTDSDKNRFAMDIINRFISHCCWMNMHIVPPHGEVFEIRVAQGYGARWSRDGTKFIGFLEPYIEDVLRESLYISPTVVSCSLCRRRLASTTDPIMPKQIHEIKDFLLTARRKDARSVKIKRSKDLVKFKVRCSRYLYTLCVFDKEKADKLKQSLPPGLSVQDL
ncbi:hypothetical protein AALP_AA4G224000 [Arabis alpina]|uniref:60S ribosomal protein L38 n=1 Tax=Arabis alpina TaxID=50452 RepID=A0A087H4X5_ARAAL|nr:hypothetical protein AALP_AA4G224000 [Arabis alpina]